ncbi:MAG: hypothetical protein RLY93_06000 [Sumerlaeia bacterium]
MMNALKAYPFKPIHLYGLAASLFCLIYFALSFKTFGTVDALVESGDQGAFYNLAKEPFFSKNFWLGGRPPVVPFVHKLAGQEHVSIFRWQLTIHVFATLILSACAFIVLGRRLLGLLGVIGILLLSLSPQVSAWAIVARSESVAFSLLLTLLGLVLLTFRAISEPSLHWRWLPLSSASLIGTLALLILTRDHWMYFAPLLAATIAGSAFASRKGDEARHRCTLWTLAGTIFLLFLLFFISSQMNKASGRWKTNLSNVIFMRILPNTDAKSHWNKEYGLPLDETILKWTAEPVWSFNRTIIHHPPYIDWLNEHGLSSFKRYILTHPQWSLDLSIRGYRSSIDNFVPNYTKDKGRELRFVRWLEHKAFPRFGGYGELLLIACTSIGLLIALTAGRPDCSALGWTILLFGIGAATQSAVVTLADSVEIERHHLPITLLIRYLALLTILAVPVWLAEIRIRLVEAPTAGPFDEHPAQPAIAPPKPQGKARRRKR